MPNTNSESANRGPIKQKQASPHWNHGVRDTTVTGGIRSLPDKQSDANRSAHKAFDNKGSDQKPSGTE